MKEIAVLLVSGLLSSTIYAEATPVAPAPIPTPGSSVTIPLNLLEIEFEICTQKFPELGNVLLNAYCQCITTQYYQNMSYMSYMHFLDGLSAKDVSAINYKQKTSSFCFASIAKKKGP